MKNISVLLKNVSKKYILHHEKPTLSEGLFKKKEAFWALKNINLKIGKGEKLGIIGKNGAGKSTLLKILTGITAPTSGTVLVKGKIASLIDVEAGFEPELTGEENIYLNGLLLGMNKKEIKKNFDQIIEFAEIGKFIDSPLYTYSTGMKLRLGFSVAISCRPDILIIDEILTTGDEYFQKKSLAKIEEFFKARKTIIFVSHNLRAIEKLCPQTLWLEKGEIKMIGASKKVISLYLKTIKTHSKVS